MTSALKLSDRISHHEGQHPNGVNPSKVSFSECYNVRMLTERPNSEHFSG
jgi:hypothetical protein